MCMRFALACVLCAVAAASSARAQTCTFSISPTTATFTSAGGSDVINITLVTGAATCQRTATSNANWITISYGTPGTGSGTVGYTVQSNPFPVERTGTITVAGQTHTVTEAAGSCTYSISPSSVPTRQVERSSVRFKSSPKPLWKSSAEIGGVSASDGERRGTPFAEGRMSFATSRLPGGLHGHRSAEGS